MPLNTHIGQVLKGKWTLVKYIAAGACAEVWEVGCSDKTAAQEGGSKTWVAKIVAEPPTMTAAEKKKKRKKASDEEIFARTLSWEHSLYNGLLRDHTSVPRTPMRDDWGTEHGLCYLVMERLGPTLSEAFEDAGRCWPNSVLASYSRQMLQSLKECHERKLLFIDVKPENFMLVSATLQQQADHHSFCLCSYTYSPPPSLLILAPFAPLPPFDPNLYDSNQGLGRPKLQSLHCRLWGCRQVHRLKRGAQNRGWWRRRGGGHPFVQKRAGAWGRDSRPEG
jgi:serine/threonine protein kinase